MSDNKNNSTTSTTTEKKPLHFLSGEELDLHQDQQLLEQCLSKINKKYGTNNHSSLKSLWQRDLPCDVEMYQLPGCPYCAKVSALLDYYKVPHTAINIDTLSIPTQSTAKSPSSGYATVPQLQLVTNPDAPWGSPERGPFIADSKFIVQKLAPVLGYQSQLDDPRVQASLARLDPFIKATFTAMAAWPGNAMILYSNMAAPHYQWYPLQLVGACVLSAMGVMCRMSSNKPIAAHQEEFLAARPAGQPFHGGDKPDIVDIQMYGVTRNVLRHSVVSREMLRPPVYYEWILRMMERVPVPYGRLALQVPRPGVVAAASGETPKK